MPYSTNEALPASVRRNLPPHAQDVFRETFNAALERYRDDATAFRVAWAAVKRTYEKVDGAWVRRADRA